MHTASQVWFESFAAAQDGTAIDARQVLDWGPRDRFGIVVREPFGALGAGLLISLATAAFYDQAGCNRRSRELYPEIYLFHVGQCWGDHSPFDFWPERKELSVEADPVAVLSAINGHGITHLAVPDGTPGPLPAMYREPEAARDQIKQCFAYAASGTVPGSDVKLSTHDARVLANFANTLQPELWLPEVERCVAEGRKQGLSDLAFRELERVVGYTHERWHEVPRDSSAYIAAKARIDGATRDGSISETYRRISTDAALALLG